MASLVVDELILPVTGMRLVRGGIELTGSRSGPCEPVSGNIRVFTDTGEPVTDAAGGEPSVVDLPRVRAKDTVSVTYVMYIETRMGL